jgi:hypothetical protein
MGVMSDEDRMDALLRQMAAEEYNRPPQIVPREAMWEGVLAGLGAQGTAIPLRRRVPNWIYFAVAAVLLLAVGIQVGRRLGPAGQEQVAQRAPKPASPDSSAKAAPDSAHLTPQTGATPNEPRQDVAVVPETDDGGGKGLPKPKGGPERGIEPTTSDDGATRAYTVAAAQHLTEAEAMLTAFKGDLSQGRMDGEIAAWGKDLLSNTRLLLDSPAANDPTRRKLLQDLELVLVQIVQLSPKSSARDRDLIKGALTDDQVLTRLRTAIPVKGT